MSDQAHMQNEAIPREKARQGVTGMNVRLVLGISLAGAVLAVAAVYVLVS